MLNQNLFTFPFFMLLKVMGAYAPSCQSIYFDALKKTLAMTKISVRKNHYLNMF